MGASSVRQASEAEAIDMLRQHGVAERLSASPERIEKGQCFIVGDALLLILMPHTGDDVEAHIACPRQHWHQIHSLIDTAIQFIAKIGYNSIYTNVAENLPTTANLIMKHGFEWVETIGTERIYRWVSERR